MKLDVFIFTMNSEDEISLFLILSLEVLIE